MPDKRPDPEALLKVVNQLESNINRGTLRVFLGMCPGVGKTYAMLRAAKEQTNYEKVLIGLVETHGRKETQNLLKDLEVLPRKKYEYKSSMVEEMDLDEILKRAPDLVIVDELAHTNAPGARHTRRYQDVEELLAAGINVYTTLNIQHIESRNDQVAQITGVIVKETVPDSFLEKATQIEVIDLSPGELLRRLKEGKVYLGERAELASKNFFKEENLTALRELALRFTAEKVDQDLRYQMTLKGIEGPWNTNERLLVAFSHSPYSARLIRTTRRMAYNLEAPWIALYIDTGERLSLDDQEMLQKNLALAKELGAEVVTISDTNMTSAIQRVCQNKNVTQIVMGRPDRRFFRDMIARGTLLDQLARTTSKIDVHVIRAERPPKFKGFHIKLPSFTSSWIGYYNTIWFLAAVSVFCYGLLPYAGYRALGSIFLLCILIVASFTSRGPILFAAIVSAFVWNFFFIPPRFTFVISSFEDIMMVISFFITALVAGFLTSRIRRQERILEAREQRSTALYELGKDLLEAKDFSELLGILSSTVENQFKADSTLFLKKDGKLDRQHFSYKANEKDFAVAQWCFENKKSAGWSTQTLSASSCLCLPMRGNSSFIGVFLFYPNKKQKFLSIEEENFLDTVLGQVSIAIERFQFAEKIQTTKILEASEKLHQVLINSVSHELRTPITTIIGSSTALQDEAIINNKQSRNTLIDDLVKSSHRLNRVVENLLDISRLEKGTLELKKEWFEAQDLIGEVLTELKDEIQDREIKIFGEKETLIEGDFRLLAHSLSNILNNAIKYSKGLIEIEVVQEKNQVKILVKDRGDGIPEGSEELLFDKFYRLPGTPSGGLGLGLSIVKNVVELHGGNVKAQNRSDNSGTIFEIRLPVRSEPAELKEIQHEG